MHDYAPRQIANEDSRTTAEHHWEVWEAHEIELLVECWSEATLPEIAETLGRTIEACRQKYYSYTREREHAVRVKQRKASHNSQWDKGWTSLEDMGY